MAQVEKTRAPQQDRSKNRYNEILNATKDLILERGSAQLKIQDIAKRAGSTTGAIYRYFPNKHAIIEALLAQYFDSFDTMIPIELIEINSVEEMVEVLQNGYDQVYQLHEAEPVLRDLLASGAADKKIQQYDLADSRKRAKAIFLSSRHLFPPENWPQLEQYLLLILHVVTPAIHMVLSLEPEEREGMVKLNKSWASVEFFSKFL
ncbi:MAG: TetR/AcrR family transcriptional regulator [Chloroflexota bacterium]